MSTLAVKCLVSLESLTLTEDVFSKGTEVVGISEEELDEEDVVAKVWDSRRACILANRTCGPTSGWCAQPEHAERLLGEQAARARSSSDAAA